MVKRVFAHGTLHFCAFKCHNRSVIRGKSHARTAPGSRRAITVRRASSIGVG